MTNLRSNDCAGSDAFNRSDRVINDSDSGLWFFRTREGNSIGPFRYRSEAEEMLARFVSQLQEANSRETAATKLHFRIQSSPRVPESGLTVS